MQRKVVVLGAGFSKHFANIPIVSEINDEICQWLDTDERLQHLSALAPKRNPNERLEDWLSRLAEPAVWMDPSDRTISLLLVDEINQRVAKLIFNKQDDFVKYNSKPRESLPADLLQLVKHWRGEGECDQDSETCIISLNYDTLVERAINHLDNNPAAYRLLHPFRIPAWAHYSGNTEDLQLLKLHGSINLWSSPTDSNRVIDVGVQNHGCKCEPGEDWWAHQKAHAPGFYPLVVPPISAKTSLLETTFLKNYWVVANEYIKNADLITVIGYSLPPEDRMLIRMLGNSRADTKFSVVNRTTAGVIKQIEEMEREVVYTFESQTAISDYVASLCVEAPSQLKDQNSLGVQIEESPA